MPNWVTNSWLPRYQCTHLLWRHLRFLRYSPYLTQFDLLSSLRPVVVREGCISAGWWWTTLGEYSIQAERSVKQIMIHCRYLYFADYGNVPHIGRYNLDGKNHQVIARFGVQISVDLSIDLQTHQIYWTDLKAGVMERVDWDGANREIVKSNLPNPYGITVFQQTVCFCLRSECVRLVDDEMCDLHPLQNLQFYLTSSSSKIFLMANNMMNWYR